MINAGRNRSNSKITRTIRNGHRVARSVCVPLQPGRENGGFDRWPGSHDGARQELAAGSGGRMRGVSRPIRDRRGGCYDALQLRDHRRRALATCNALSALGTELVDSCPYQCRVGAFTIRPVVPVRGIS